MISLFIAWALIRFFRIASIENDRLSTFFISLGAMTGGIIAIVFTLSIFAKQSAADLYSSQHFEVYTHDWVEKFAYIAIVIITLLFFGLGILFGEEVNIPSDTFRLMTVYGSLFLVGVIFAIIDWQYKNVRSKVNPINAFVFLEKQAINFLNRVHKDAQRMAKTIRIKNNNVSEGMVLASIYNSYLVPHLANLDRQIENLFEISMKLSDKHEIKTTNRGLAAVHNILARFLNVRKDSSLALLSNISLFALESDSQNFLSRSFERFNNAGEGFILTRRIENARFIVDVYKSLAMQSKEINFINKPYENPIFDLTKGYLGFYINFAIREKDQEIVLQGTRALSDLAMIAIEKNWEPSLFGIQNDLLKIAIFGITSRATFIVDEYINSSLRIMRAVFHYKSLIADHAIREALQNIKTITVYMDTAIESGILSGEFANSMILSKPYDELILTIGIIINGFFSLSDGEEKTRYKTDFISFLKEVYDSLRRLSEEIHDCASLLIDSIGRLIFNINSLIIELLDKNEFKEEGIEEELKRNLSWNIYLPSWFSYHARKFRASSAFDTLTDSIAKTGIILFQKEKSESLIMDCIKSLYSMVKHCLEKVDEGYGYDEPRQMVKVVYLGVLALKHNKRSVLDKIKEQIREFEGLHKKKYLSDLKLPPGVSTEAVIGLPREDQLFHEVFDWRDEFIHQKHDRHRIMDIAQERMFDVIDELDIDRFMFDVWQEIPSDSPLVGEIETEVKKSTPEKDGTEPKK